MLDEKIWYEGGVTLLCPICGNKMAPYESENNIIWFQCENQQCNCRIVIDGEILEDYKE